MRASCFLLLALAACRSTSTRHAPGPASVRITRAAPVRAWELWESGRCLGSMVRFEETADPERAFYSVLNREGQEIGMVDLHGRAWRHRAHESQPQWVGTGTVTEGARHILEGTQAAELIEVDLKQLQGVLEQLRRPH